MKRTTVGPVALVCCALFAATSACTLGFDPEPPDLAAGDDTVRVDGADAGGLADSSTEPYAAGSDTDTNTSFVDGDTSDAAVGDHDAGESGDLPGTDTGESEVIEQPDSSDPDGGGPDEPPPLNPVDNTCGAIDLGTSLGQWTGSISGHPNNHDVDECASLASPEVFYSWVAPEKRSYLFNTGGTSFNNALFVYDSICPGDLLACSDEARTSNDIVLDLERFQRVTVRVDGIFGGAGDYVLNIGALNSEAGHCQDGFDNDADGLVDCEDLPDCADVGWYTDADEDGYGDENDEPVMSCTPLEGRVPNADDCNDDHVWVNPELLQFQDEPHELGWDWNCNGEIEHLEWFTHCELSDYSNGLVEGTYSGCEELVQTIGWVDGPPACGEAADVTICDCRFGECQVETCPVDRSCR